MLYQFLKVHDFICQLSSQKKKREKEEKKEFLKQKSNILADVSTECLLA